MDVETAFLNGKVWKYMSINQKVMRMEHKEYINLSKALYGLKESPRD